MSKITESAILPILQQKSINCTHVETFSTSHNARRGKISDFFTLVMQRSLKFLHMWRNIRCLHICHVQISENAPHILYVIYVTNMRYDPLRHPSKTALLKCLYTTIFIIILTDTNLSQLVQNCKLVFFSEGLSEALK